MERFYFDSIEDILKLIDEPMPTDGLYHNSNNINDHFLLVYDLYTPIIIVDLSKVTSLGVLKMWESAYDENMPVIDSSFIIAEHITHEYDIKKWIEIGIACEPDGRLMSIHMREEDALAIGFKEIERDEKDVRFTD